MMGSPAEGTKEDASTRKRWPERVTAGASRRRSLGFGAAKVDCAGDTGCGGRTVE